MNKSILLTIIFAIIAVGATSAYAVNLDLKADTTVTGNLAVTGDITGQTITALTTAISSAPICPAQNVVHWDKIMFYPMILIGSCDVNFPIPPGNPPELLIPQGNFIYDIKVLDDPTKVADLNQKVVTFLNSLNYCSPGGTTGDLQPMDVFVLDVDYSIVCTVPP